MNKPKDTIGKSVAQLYRINSKFLVKKYQKFNIGSGQYFFLIELYRRDGVSQEYLSEELNVDKGTTAKAMKKLEDLGYIKRLRCENDKRLYKIFLTDKALEIKEEFFSILKENDKKIRALITEDELNMVTTILQKISKGLGDETHE